MSEVETVPQDEVTEVIPTPTLETLNAGQQVTFELLEEFTGKRTVKVTDPDADEMDEEPDMVDAEVNCNDIMVKFTNDNTGQIIQRAVNVCFDADGKYDETETLVRISEVREGVIGKMALNLVVN